MGRPHVAPASLSLLLLLGGGDERNGQHEGGEGTSRIARRWVVRRTLGTMWDRREGEAVESWYWRERDGPMTDLWVMIVWCGVGSRSMSLVRRGSERCCTC